MDTGSDSRADLRVIRFREKPLATFAASLDDCLNPDEPGQKTWAAFVDAIRDVDTAGLDVDPTLLKVNTDRLPKKKGKEKVRVKRSEVFDLAADPNVTVATVCVAAMAWGGMRIGQLETALSSRATGNGST